MYVIIVYDVGQSRVAKVCQYFKRFLHWVQNSAFEGEISRALSMLLGGRRTRMPNGSSKSRISVKAAFG
ncbi:MAG: CRISPR-associated endonuclease Cas2 [Desulfofundulus sp.]